MRNLIAALALTSTTLWAAQPSLGQEQEPGATVEVQNNFEDRVEVLVEAGQFDRRLGTVDGLSTAELPLPAWIVERDRSVELFVIRDGRDLESQAFEAQPGDRIGMVVPPPAPNRQQMTAMLPREKLWETTLTVENQRSEEMVIYAEEDLFGVRLGTVAPNSTETLQFPESIVKTGDRITVVVEPRGTFEMESHPFQLEEGEHIGLKILER